MKSVDFFELTPIQHGGKYGFQDKKGNIVIPCQWEMVSLFHEGLALVRDNKHRYGYIDKSGEIIIPCIFIDACDFQNGTATVAIGDLSPINYDDFDVNDIPESSYIVIDKKGMPLDDNEELLDYLCLLEEYCMDSVGFIRDHKRTDKLDTYDMYNGTYVQDELGYSDDEIDTIFDGNPDAYWNID